MVESWPFQPASPLVYKGWVAGLIRCGSWRGQAPLHKLTDLNIGIFIPTTWEASSKSGHWLMLACLKYNFYLCIYYIQIYIFPIFFQILAVSDENCSTKIVACGAESVMGDLEVTGSNVFKSYWNKPNATAKEFTQDGWFKTGELYCFI